MDRLAVRRAVTFSMALPLVVTAPSSNASAVVFSASGANAAAVQPTVDSFRTALGVNNGTGGFYTAGRREIGWDDVPDSSAAPNSLPATYFNLDAPRGAVFSTPGTGFQVSASNSTGTPVRFGNLNPAYTTTFITFSAERLFTPLNGNVFDVTFFMPGTNTPAFVSSFGAVFSDVDAAATTMQFFDTNGLSLGSFAASAFNGGLSFLGVVYNAGERIGRARVTLGNSMLGPADGGAATDVVVADDLIYGEPRCISDSSGPIVTPSPSSTFTQTICQ
ncbi:MAG TPA: hypothetical protein VGR00_10235 [Thermoanaerobaculia bacterium]|nr:hypothetical protein [Thermoanaerobaculia bacterium]